MGNSRYSIHEGMIIDAESNPVPKIYIRELLDVPSYEYQNSKLSVCQKLEVIQVIGLEKLIKVLNECYRVGGKTYDAAQEAEYAMLILRRKVAQADAHVD